PYLNSNPSDSTYTQYDAVFILNATGATDSLGPDNLRPWSGKSTGCYPCSLTTYTQYPRVPVLFISGAQTAMTQTQYGSSNRALIQLG
ncbi:hypothetical protein, partial [Klebsiella quasipneumoniae]|uniref:hypothetical protein n=1 Tax=Klebsiella quasipneumoniae TaxID=1463165 RepID=UPI00164505F5